MVESPTQTSPRREWFIVVAGYTFLTLLLTYPLVTCLTDRYLGDGRDGFQNTWNFWWVARALSEGRNPYQTDFLFHPTGTTLLFHTLDPLTALFAWPLRTAMGMVAAYNLIALTTFVASGVAMYSLARREVGPGVAAFLAGVIFAFCPYRMGHALGHLNLMSTHWIPLFIWFVLRLEVDSRRSLICLTALVWAACFFSALYYAYCLLLVTPVLLILKQRFRGWDSMVAGGRKRLAAALGLAAALTSPVWLAMFEVQRHESFRANLHDPQRWSGDLLSFFVPGSLSTWGEFFSGTWNRFSGNAAEGSLYLGMAVLGLSAYAWCKVPASRLWGALSLVFFILALGPRLRAGGISLPVPLPYALLQNLPLVSISTVPARFSAVLMCGLSLSATWGLREILDGWRRNDRAGGVGLLACGVVLLEYLCLPFPTAKLVIPQFYRNLATESGDFAVVECPFSATIMHYQTVHGKRLVDGYVSRAPESALRFVRETPLINALADQVVTPRGNRSREARALFDRLDVRYVITHTRKHRSFLERDLRLPVVHREPGLQVYGTKATLWDGNVPPRSESLP